MIISECGDRCCKPREVETPLCILRGDHWKGYATEAKQLVFDTIRNMRKANMV